MKISSVRFRGYKAFSAAGGSWQQLTLAPLTLVFGKNSSGKSAVVRLPRILLAGIECNDGQVLPMKVRGLSYGQRFLDVVHGGAFFGVVGFGLNGSVNGDPLDFSVDLFNRDMLSADKPPEVWSYSMLSPQAIDLSVPSPGDGRRTNFRGLLPPEVQWDKIRAAATSVLNESVHLGPTRAPVEPVYSPQRMTTLGLLGAETPYLLLTNAVVADALSEWFVQNLDGWRLALKRETDSFSLQVARTSLMSTNLAQAGQGFQQVLPVVALQLWRQNSLAQNYVDVIEQPELHLHPAAQAPLADLFIGTAQKQKGVTLVETNSEPLLLRVQRRVAEGALSKTLVAIYYVDLTDEGSQLRRITINDSGEFDWWPDGVFDEDFVEVAAMRRAQKKSSSGESRAK